MREAERGKGNGEGKGDEGVREVGGRGVKEAGEGGERRRRKRVREAKGAQKYHQSRRRHVLQ